MRKIGDGIHLGAMVFMAREYKMLSIFALVLLIAIFVSPLGKIPRSLFSPGRCLPRWPAISECSPPPRPMFAARLQRTIMARAGLSIAFTAAR